MNNTYEWDIFISHASEDKDNLVKPLAITLDKFGARIWYDEFTLKMGDSLVRSIDKGLSKSRYGVVIISKAFMEKRWPEYEIQGLVSLEIAGKGKRIIPVWHGVNRNDVLKFSPSLADKIAGDTSRLNILELTLGIIEVVRPDIFYNLQRLAYYREMQKSSQPVNVPLDKLVDGPIRHKTLSPSLLVRIRIINRIFSEVFPQHLMKTIENFRRDMFPEREIEVWERMAAVYLYFIDGHTLSLEHKKEIFEALLLVSFQDLSNVKFSKFKYVTQQMIVNQWKKEATQNVEEQKQKSTNLKRCRSK